MLIYAFGGTLALIFIILLAVYAKGQRDRERALILERMQRRQKYKKLKDVGKLKDKLRRGEF
jgi:hypothetical protein